MESPKITLILFILYAMTNIIELNIIERESFCSNNTSHEILEDEGDANGLWNCSLIDGFKSGPCAKK
jgi:hypothetical protein